MAAAWTRYPFRAVAYATAAFAMSVLIVAAGFTFPRTIGLLINPHSRVGSIGGSALMAMDMIVLLVLVFFLPYSVLILARHKETRKPGLIGIVAAGGIAAAIIGWGVAVIAVDRL
jgi:hypothetical protein